jgi:hypothetical protein
VLAGQFSSASIHGRGEPAFARPSGKDPAACMRRVSASLQPSGPQPTRSSSARRRLRRSATAPLFFENLVDDALLCHGLEQVFRQITDFLIARRCLQRELTYHGWCQRQLRRLFFAVVPHANAERHSVCGRRDTGCRPQRQQPSSRSRFSQADPQPGASDFQCAHGHPH